MKAKLLLDGAEKVYAVVFDVGDEVMAGLEAFARERGLDSAQITAIGAFSRATFGYYDRERKEYDKIPVEEQVEVLSLLGDISLNEGKPQVHVHGVVGRRDGTTRGGHLLEAYVWPTLEVIVTESPGHLRRRMSEEAGLPLIALDAD
jgi:predicted DNA-binding protein with PD1-like motif